MTPPLFFSACPPHPPPRLEAGDRFLRFSVISRLYPFLGILVTALEVCRVLPAPVALGKLPARLPAFFPVAGLLPVPCPRIGREELPTKKTFLNQGSPSSMDDYGTPSRLVSSSAAVTRRTERHECSPETTRLARGVPRMDREAWSLRSTGCIGLSRLARL
jgi:hypothetical protein